MDELAEKVKEVSDADAFRFTRPQEAFDALKQRVGELEAVAAKVEELQRRADKVEPLPETAVRHDERLKSLEKWHDRAFQIAPMVISAAGVVIALIALFVKK